MGKIVSIREVFKNKQRKIRGYVTSYLRGKIKILLKEGFGKAIVLDNIIKLREARLCISGLGRKIKEFRYIGVTSFKGKAFLYMKKENILLPSPSESLPPDPRWL